MPRQPLTIVEKQQRQLLRKLARGAGKRIAHQSEVVNEQARREVWKMQKFLNDREVRQNRIKGVSANQRARNLGEAVRSVTSVVRASFGLDQPVKYEYLDGALGSRILSAKTNLKEILLTINTTRLFSDDEQSIKKTIAILKGATYHEAAHCLWTKDWKTYEFPEGFDLWDYFQAWNLLEDGRIETLLIEKSPVIRNYLLPLLYEVVLSKNPTGWANTVDGAPFLIVRSYLPKGIQRAVIRACQIDGRDMTLLADMHRVSTAYQQANSWDEQIPYVVEFHELMGKWRPDGDGLSGNEPSPHGDHTWTKDTPDSKVDDPVFKRVSKPQDGDWDRNEITSIPTPSSTDDNEKVDDDAGGQGDESSQNDESSQDEANDTNSQDAHGDNSTTQSGGDTDAEKTGESDGDGESKSVDSQHGKAGTGQGDNEPQHHSTVREMIEDGFESAVNESVTSHELNEVISQYHKALSRGLQKGAETMYEITDPNTISVANNITLGMINALDTVVVTPDPSWKYHMDDGAILDLESFINRDIGDDSYWIDKDGTGERGHDLAVSLLLDCSASMNQHFTELGVVGYAIRKACDYFNIPCTTVLFGDEYQTQLLWDIDDEPKLITMPSLGGTEIGEALIDIPNHRYDKTRHLVVILTDGDWCDIDTVRPFLKNGETSLLVGLKTGLESLQHRGADIAISIDSLIDLPLEVEKSIARFFA